MLKQNITDTKMCPKTVKFSKRMRKTFQQIDSAQRAFDNHFVANEAGTYGAGERWWHIA